MAEITIYNRNQIGRCVTVVSSAKAGIMIDFGENLPGTESAAALEFDWEAERIDAVLFTHYHGDHIGRFREIPPGIPLYMGKVTRQVMTTIAKYIKDEEALRILRDDSRIHEVKAAETFSVQDIRITPYMVDHSAFDAYMYLLETPDQTILHTGDFRGHGYRGKKIIPMIRRYIRQNGTRKIDVLITEGTMLSRRAETAYSEAELLKDCIRLFQKHRYVFLICSSTNADTLATFYQAAQSRHIKMFASRYVCEQISHFRSAAEEYRDSISNRKKTAEEYRNSVNNWEKTTEEYRNGINNQRKETGTSLGPYDFKYVYEYDPDAEIFLAKAGKTIKQEELMRKQGFCTVIKAEKPYRKWIERFQEFDPIVVYSMWEGYLNPEHKAYDRRCREFLDSCSHVEYMHTGGHASAELIAEVINAVEPEETIYPIHTENAKELEQLPIKEELRKKIRYE